MIFIKNKFHDIKTKRVIFTCILSGITLLSVILAYLYTPTPTKTIIGIGFIYFVIEHLINNFFIEKFITNIKSEYNSNFDKELNDIIFENIPDLMTFQDSELKYKKCSKSFIQTFGLDSSKQVLEKTPYEVFSKLEQNILSVQYQKMISEDKHKSLVEFSLSDSNPNSIFEILTVPQIKNGKPSGVLTIGKKKFDNPSYVNMLKLSNLYKLIESAPMLAYIFDTQGNFICGNPRACRFFNEGIDVTLNNEIIYFNPEYLKKTLSSDILQIIQKGNCINTEKRLISKNGDKSLYLVNQIPLKDENENIYAIINFSSNIDAEKRICEERETYIATLSHDLKTPTIAQIRAIELLLSGQMGKLNPEQTEILNLTLDSCKHMYDMIYTLLSTYKFENGEITLNYSSFDINSMILESISEISNLADDNSIKIEFISSESIAKICADKMEIKRVIVNILSNAVNYAYPSTTVYVATQITGNKIEVKVQNSSAYITPENMSKLFRKYVTHSEKYNKVGMGLGLYLSKKIIHAHKGKIIAESSQKQQKAVFGFIIPVSRDKSVNFKFKQPASAL